MDTEVCTRCGGRGEITYIYDEYNYDYMSCGSCGGTGQVRVYNVDNVTSIKPIKKEEKPINEKPRIDYMEIAIQEALKKLKELKNK